MFTKRREINENFGNLFDEVIGIGKLMILFEFSLKEFGMIDVPQTDMIFKIITKIKQNFEALKKFIKTIRKSTKMID